MGGSDSNDYTSFLLKSIIKFPNIKIYVIVGPFYKKFNSLSNLISKYPHIQLKQSSQSIWLDFYKSDLVISSGGTILYELALQGLPTISVPLNQHQNEYAKDFSKHDFCVNLGTNKKLIRAKLSKQINLIINDLKIQKEMSKNGKKLVDGKGIDRIKIIINSIKFQNT